MDGIINVLKPPGMTSFDVVSYLRRLTHIKRIGHTGTLDPGAVGVLPVCIGNATKVIEYMTDNDKKYRAELTLGTTTDTQDSTGEVMDTFEVNLNEDQIRSAIETFKGKIQQVPPMYSALKFDGQRLYDLTRKGITVERKARDIEIYSINIISINGELKNITSEVLQRKPLKVIFDVECSKGTYIRTLCADIGEKLGCGGHMSFLIRLSAGVFDISNAMTLEELSSYSEKGEITACMTPVDSVLGNYEKIVLNQLEEKKFLNGLQIQIQKSKYENGQALRVYNTSEYFIALGEVTMKQDLYFIKSIKVF